MPIKVVIIAIHRTGSTSVKTIKLLCILYKVVVKKTTGVKYKKKDYFPFSRASTISRTTLNYSHSASQTWRWWTFEYANSYAKHWKIMKPQHTHQTHTLHHCWIMIEWNEKREERAVFHTRFSMNTYHTHTQTSIYIAIKYIINIMQ